MNIMYIGFTIMFIFLSTLLSKRYETPIFTSMPIFAGSKCFTDGTIEDQNVDFSKHFYKKLRKTKRKRKRRQIFDIYVLEIRLNVQLFSKALKTCNFYPLPKSFLKVEYNTSQLRGKLNNDFLRISNRNKNQSFIKKTRRQYCG